MSTVLAQYPSASNPNIAHQIILGSDGVTYCSCTAWKMHKTCKHLVHYNSQTGTPVPPMPAFPTFRVGLPKYIPACTGFKIRSGIGAIKYPCILDIKYDGILVYVKYKRGSPLRLTTKEGNQFFMEYGVFSEEAESGEFLAELIHGDGKNGTLYNAMSQRAIKGMPGCIIKVFDVLRIDYKDFSEEDLATRKTAILDNIKDSYVGKMCVCENKIQVIKLSEESIKEGYEGCVAKNTNETFLNQRWCKMKLTDQVELMVTKVEPTRFEVDHGGVTVGVKLVTQVQVGQMVRIQHNGILASGSLRNPVHKTI